MYSGEFISSGATLLLAIATFIVGLVVGITIADNMWREIFAATWQLKFPSWFNIKRKEIIIDKLRRL